MPSSTRRGILQVFGCPSKQPTNLSFPPKSKTQPHGRFPVTVEFQADQPTAVLHSNKRHGRWPGEADFLLRHWLALEFGIHPGGAFGPRGPELRRRDVRLEHCWTPGGALKGPVWARAPGVARNEPRSFNAQLPLEPL